MVYEKDSLVMPYVFFYTKKYGILLFLVLYFFLFVASVDAVTLDKSSYTQGEEMLVTDVSGLLIIYNFDTQEYIMESQAYDPDWNINDMQAVSGNFVPGDYTLMEMSAFVYCGGQFWSYDDCKADPAFMNEALFTIREPSGGFSQEEIPLGVGVVSYLPTIEITSPQRKSFFSKEIPIIYKATDQNDSDSGAKESFGLVGSPVSLFYSDRFIDVDTEIVRDEDKILIAKNLPAMGSYIWKNHGLKEGIFYKIIISAIDAAGQIGQKVSGYFNLDLVAPTYIVTASPAVAKNEDVTITIKSSESLIAIPKVAVRQWGGSAIPIKVINKNGVYTGVYKVVSGFDGTARVEIIGTDSAGNEGILIVGGGTFSVGINPPQKPVITSPAENENVTTENITIQGTGRDDTQIIVTINGVETYTTVPSANGVFIVENVHLKKNAKNGQNIINITAKDRANMISESVVRTILFNSAPNISLVKPTQGAILSGITTVTTKAVDDNSDLIHFRYELAPAGTISPTDADWKSVVDAPNSTVYFDTTKFLDGAYLLRVIADDGVMSSITTPIPVSIRNEASFFIRFYDGPRTTVSSNTALMRGAVYAQKNTSTRSIIKSLEYSLNRGATWVPVTAQDGAFDSAVERFEVVIKDLKDGSTNVTWRTTDSRGLVVTSEQPIIVDKVAPKQPVIVFPESAVALTKENNETREKGKFVFSVRGTAEPGTIVNAEVNGKKFIGKVSFDGTFRIADIGLPSHGKYTIKAFVVDEALNKSSLLEYVILYDTPPSIVITSPSDGRGIGKETTLAWLTSDVDGDRVTTTSLSYRQIGKQPVVLAKNFQENSFVWNTATLSEGSAYELSITASDGVTSTTRTVPFSIDRTPPSVSLFEVTKVRYGKGEIVTGEGKAQDANSGVLFVEYRFLSVGDDGDDIPWYKAITTSGSSRKNNVFSIANTSLLSDGEYQLVVRAIDTAGNGSVEKSQQIIIDSTPPRIGSFELYSDEKKVLPNNGVWRVARRTSCSIGMSLESDTKDAFLTVNEKTVSLKRDLATGLWKGICAFDQLGTTIFFVSATDGIGNTVTKQPIVVLEISENTSSKKEIPRSSLWYSILHVLHLR